jgi:hypothetical protein
LNENSALQFEYRIYCTADGMPIGHRTKAVLQSSTLNLQFMESHALTFMRFLLVPTAGSVFKLSSVGVSHFVLGTICTSYQLAFLIVVADGDARLVLRPEVRATCCMASIEGAAAVVKESYGSNATYLQIDTRAATITRYKGVDRTAEQDETGRSQNGHHAVMDAEGWRAAAARATAMPRATEHGHRMKIARRQKKQRKNRCGRERKDEKQLPT